MDRVEYEKLIIQDLLNLNQNDELNLHPWYQRRSVWTRAQKAYLINTIFEKKPIPSIYVRHSIDIEKGKSIKEVVDGQQRITAVLEYDAGGFPAKHPGHRSPVKYSELTKPERLDFRLTSLSVGYLLGALDDDVIEIFGRLNSVAKTLNLQEKRNARFSGEFKQFCLKEAAKRVQLWRDLGIFTANEIARMGEVQFVSELALNMLNGLSDYSARAIDQAYTGFEDRFPKQRDLEARMEAVFSLIASLPVTAIRDTIFSRAPIFFTLFLVLDGMKCKIPGKRVEEAIFAVDKEFRSDTPVGERASGDAAFYVACTSNMHRIKSRRIREEYIRDHLKA